tara:strand:+ start:75 stop:317 length:243 start_codon:yes stop_codon:yes gene_type:complete
MSNPIYNNRTNTFSFRDFTFSVSIDRTNNRWTLHTKNINDIPVLKQGQYRQAEQAMGDYLRKNKPLAGKRIIEDGKVKYR